MRTANDASLRRPCRCSERLTRQFNTEATSGHRDRLAIELQRETDGRPEKVIVETSTCQYPNDLARFVRDHWNDAAERHTEISLTAELEHIVSICYQASLLR